jgi:hypothetical protein
VDVGWTEIGVIHCADADEPNSGTGSRVVAPNRDLAGRAACNLLTLADGVTTISGSPADTIRRIERVESMGGPGLALAPMAMASMGDQ